MRARALQRAVGQAQKDPLSRTTTLLVADNVTLAVAGAICSVIMTRLWPAHDVGAVASISGR